MLLAGCREYQDIVFALDRSGSISNAVFSGVYSAVRAVVDAMDLDDGTGGQKEKVRVGVQTFTSKQEVVSHLNEFGPLPAAPPVPPTDLLTNVVEALE